MIAIDGTKDKSDIVKLCSNRNGEKLVFFKGTILDINAASVSKACNRSSLSHINNQF